MKQVFSIILLLFSLCLLSQEKDLIKDINQKADYITTDRLGNLYLVKDNYIWMYNKDGDSLRSFNSQRFGSIAQLDCSDPYKLLVFFKDYNMLLFLDNFLSENGQVVDFQSIGFDQVSLACHSREAGFWAFDQIRQIVYHLDDNFEVTHQTVNFMQWFGFRIEPNYMVEYNNKLYVNAPKHGIYVFDHFGTYLKKIPLTDLHEPQIIEDYILYENEGKLCKYNRRDFETNCRSLENGNALNQARIEKGRIYLFDGEKTSLYRLN